MADENPSGLGAFDLPLRLPGQYFDTETNLHYNYHRSFDAGIGRYLQGDPAGLLDAQRTATTFEVTNLYAYVDSEPLAHFDPDGARKRS